jgi:hypothetical protein
MSTYLLTCQCSRTIPVEAGQAGERVACECGAQHEVPTLRKLRHLPVAQSEADKPRVTWSASKGFIAAGLIAAGLLVIAAAWTWWTEPAMPKFDPAGQLQAVDAELGRITPAQAWMRWVAFYQPLAKRGFSGAVYPHAAAMEQQIAQRRFLEKTLLGLAAVCAAIALIAAFWPSGTTRRRDKGTSRHG